MLTGAAASGSLRNGSRVGRGDRRGARVVGVSGHGVLDHASPVAAGERERVGCERGARRGDRNAGRTVHRRSISGSRGAPSRVTERDVSLSKRAGVVSAAVLSATGSIPSGGEVATSRSNGRGRHIVVERLGSDTARSAHSPEDLPLDSQDFAAVDALVLQAKKDCQHQMKGAQG
jgi:hypothetical protein